MNLTAELKSEASVNITLHSGELIPHPTDFSENEIFTRLTSTDSLMASIGVRRCGQWPATSGRRHNRHKAKSLRSLVDKNLVVRLAS
jgi:hypothetical protein